MKKKLLISFLSLIHLFFFMFLVSCGETCCGKCLCCTEGSPVTSSEDRSYCESGECETPKSFNEVDEDAGDDCAEACATLVGQDLGRPGCMETDADNYDPEATKSDPEACKYSGCNQTCADNYSIKATSNDGTCKYSPKCLDPTAKNYSRIYENCGGKVLDDRSKCIYTNIPDPGNADLIPAVIKETDYCVTNGSGSQVANGTEVTFRTTYSYTGSRKLQLKMMRNSLVCGTDCDKTKYLEAGQDMQAFAQGFVNSAKGSEFQYTMRIITEDPARKANEPEVFVAGNVSIKLGDAIKPCESMLTGKYKQVGDLLVPRAPQVTNLTYASGKLNVTVKHDVRDPKVVPGTTDLSETEKKPDYYVIAFDSYANRTTYTQQGKLNTDAWYKAIVENGVGAFQVKRPAKTYGEEETWALDAQSGTYAVFVKAVNGVWPYNTPPSTTPKLLATEGSPLTFRTYPLNPGKVEFQSKDRMVEAVVTIPAGITTAGFTLKANGEDYGTYNNLLGSESGRSYKIYNSISEIFSDEEFAATHPQGYYDQKAVIIKDGTDSRKFYVYTVSATLGAVTLNLTLDGAADPEYVHTLRTDPTYNFAEWIDLANRVIQFTPPSTPIPALAKKAALDFKNAGLVTKALIEVFKVSTRLEIAWIKGFYDGAIQGIVSDAEGIVGAALFFKEAVTNGSNLCRLIRQEISNFTLSGLNANMYKLFENISIHVVSEADKAILYPDIDPNSQVKAYMHGYIYGFALEQYFVGIVAMQGFSYVGRGLAYSVQLTRAGPVVMSAISAVKKWRTAVVAAAIQPLKSAAEVAAEKLKSLHSMLDRLASEIAENTPDTYAKKLGEYLDHADKTNAVDRVTSGDWSIGYSIERNLVDINVRLVGEGALKLSEEAAEGFIRLQKHVLLLEKQGGRFMDDFLEAFVDTQGKLRRDVLNADLEDCRKLEILDPDFMSRVRLPPNVLEEFRDGGSYLMTHDQYLAFVKDRNLIGRADGQFMISKSVMDDLLEEAGGDIAALQQRLGVTDWTGKQLWRIDVTDPLSLNPRYPTANLSGANSKFIFGGKTSGGLQEIVTDEIPVAKFIATQL